MGVFKLISKWNRASETFQAQQYILDWAKEEDLVKIKEAIKERREELAKKNPRNSGGEYCPTIHISSIIKDRPVNIW